MARQRVSQLLECLSLMLPLTESLEQSSRAAQTFISFAPLARTGLGLTTRLLVVRSLTSARVFHLVHLVRRLKDSMYYNTLRYYLISCRIFTLVCNFKYSFFIKT